MQINVAEHLVRMIVVTPEGRIDAFSAPTLRERLEQFLEEGVSKFVLDLTDVSFLDSAGMAVLVSLLKKTRQKGGDVKLILPSEEAAQRILRLTRFDKVFDIADSSEAALEKF